jgi:hypothetical protein
VSIGGLICPHHGENKAPPKRVSSLSRILFKDGARRECQRPVPTASASTIRRRAPALTPLLFRERDQGAPASSALLAVTTISRRAQSEYLRHSIPPQLPTDSFSRPPVVFDDRAAFASASAREASTFAMAVATDGSRVTPESGAASRIALKIHFVAQQAPCNALGASGLHWVWAIDATSGPRLSFQDGRVAPD